MDQKSENEIQAMFANNTDVKIHIIEPAISGKKKVYVEQLPQVRSPYVPPYMDVVGRTQTKITHFPDSYNPTEDPYWLPMKVDDVTKKMDCIAVIVPAFNESAGDLLTSLTSLWEQTPILAAAGFFLHVLICIDGWFKTSDSMKEYLQNTFPQDGHTPWGVNIPTISVGQERNSIDTYIVQRVEEREVVPVCFGQHIQRNLAMHMRISLLVKRDNRRKHNSHAWFLRSFCPFYTGKFMFLTDCGTQFDNFCIIHLIEYMQTRPNCAATTGRQRVMTEKRQLSAIGAMNSQPGEIQSINNKKDKKKSNESWFSFENLYRKAQGFDYEASTACFNGAFSMIGMLPVIPGPCGLYRFELMYSHDRRRVKYITETRLQIADLRATMGRIEPNRKFNSLQRNMADKQFLICKQSNELFQSEIARSSSSSNTTTVSTGTQPNDLHKNVESLLNPSHVPLAQKKQKSRADLQLLRDNSRKKDNKKSEEKQLLCSSSSSSSSSGNESRRYCRSSSMSEIEIASLKQSTNAEFDLIRNYLKLLYDKCLKWFKKLNNHSNELNSLQTLIPRYIALLEERVNCYNDRKKDIRHDTFGMERSQLRVKLKECLQRETLIRSQLDDFQHVIQDYETLVTFSWSLIFPNLEPLSPQSPHNPSQKINSHHHHHTAWDDVKTELTKSWVLVQDKNQRRRDARKQKAAVFQLEQVQYRQQKIEEELELKNSSVDPIEFYLSTVDRNPNEISMLAATLLLAEDRILSAAAVFKTDCETYTSYVPHSIFYFEAEVNEDSFLPQRRRWINGSVAGYIWLFLRSRSLVMKSKASPVTKIGSIVLIFFQIVMYFLVAMSPAIFTIGLRTSLNASRQFVNGFL